MKTSPKQVVSLCPHCSECPTVKIHDDGIVRIGEASNIVTLQRHEWNELVKAVKSGTLDEVA